MAERFARGGRLVAFGEGPVARSDARHVAVEFVHPVIVGKRALPALALTAEGGPVGAQVDLLVEPTDIALAFGEHPETVAALGLARERGCLTLAASPVGAEWELVPDERRPIHRPGARRDALPRAVGARARVLRAPRAARGARRAHGPRQRRRELPLPVSRAARGRPRGGASPTCALRCSRSPRRSAALRAQTLSDGEQELRAAARALRGRLDAGGRVLALGQRRVGDGRDGRRRRPALSARRLALAGGDRPDRGPRHPHRDRQRRRGGVDLLPAGHRPRARAGRAAGVLHQRWLAQRPGGARRGAAARTAERSRWSATTAGRSPPRGWPIT